jgi:hypothetical protein
MITNNNNLYNTTYECQYMNPNPIIFQDWELEILSKEEQLFVRNLLYKQDMMFIFYQEEAEFYANDTIHEAVGKLFAIVSKASIPELNSCMTKLASRILSTQLELGFVMLYSYDYLHLVHPCVSELLETGNILKNKQLLNELENLI